MDNKAFHSLLSSQFGFPNRHLKISCTVQQYENRPVMDNSKFNHQLKVQLPCNSGNSRIIKLFSNNPISGMNDHVFDCLYCTIMPKPCFSGRH